MELEERLVEWHFSMDAQISVINNDIVLTDTKG